MKKSNSMSIQFSTNSKIIFKGFLSLLTLILFCLGSQMVHAQPKFYNGTAGTSTNSFPLNSTTSNKVQWIYGPNVFNTSGTTGTPATAGSISKIYFRLNSANATATYTNYTVSFSQNVGTATTWSSGTYVTGLTQCFYQSSFQMTGATTGWYGLTLQTPFGYDPSKSLVFELKVSAGTGNSVGQNAAGGNTRIYGGYSASSGTANTGLVDFGFDMASVPNDVGISTLISPVSVCGDSNELFIVQIQNYGSNALSAGLGIPVTMTLSGSGSGAYTSTFDRALAIGGKDTVHMATLNSIAMKGDLTVKSWAKYSSDTVPANDSNTTTIAMKGLGVMNMSGTYTIGGTSPDFATMADAIITMGCANVTGPITLAFRPGTYNGQFEIGNIAGLSSTNTLTITSSTGNREDVILTDSTVIQNKSHIVRFNGAKFVTLRDVTVINRSKIYGWGVHIFGGSENIRVANCVIAVDSPQTSTTFIPVLVNGSDNSYTTGGYFKNIEIDSNLIKYGYAGIDFYGVSSPAYPEGIRIRNNTLFGYYVYGMYLNILTDVQVLNNFFENRTPSASTTGYGVYMSSCGSQASKPAPMIVGNRIIRVGLGGIYMLSSSGTSTYRGLIANNMVGGGFRSTTTYGIYSSSNNYFDCYYNSVFMKGGTSTTYGLYTTSSTFWNIKNNHFTVDPTATNAGYAMYINTNTSHDIDYNNYWNPNGTNLMYRGGAYTTSTYQSSTAGGANSINSKVDFTGELNLFLPDACNTIKGGTNISTVTTDIEGSARSGSNTTLGAHEPGGWTYDVGIVRLITPTVPSTGGTKTVSMLVKNFGSTAVSSLVAYYQWDNGTPVSQTFSFTTALARCDSAVITFTTTFNISKCSNFKVWTGAINTSNADEYNSNNMIEVTIGVGLSGNYTVGGASPDFATIMDAIDAMRCAGIAGPTTLNLRPGTYITKLELNDVGATSTNTLTIRSATGNPKDVILKDSNLVTTTPFATVQLVNTKWIVLRDLTIINAGKGSGWGLNIRNSQNIRIANCIIEVDSAVASTNIIPVVINNSPTSYSTGGSNMNIMLDSNLIKFGYFGVVTYGSTAPYSEGLRYRSNTLWKPYLYGFYNVTLTDLVIDGNLIDLRATTSTTYGIYMSSVSSVNNKQAPQIINNQIINSGVYGIYATSSSGVAAYRALCANNSMGGGYRSTSYGLYYTSSNYWDVWHNSVSTSGGATNVCYPYYSTSASYHDIRNNNFAVTDPSASTSSLAMYIVTNTGHVVDFNNYHNPRGTNLINIGGTTYTTSTYQSATAGGANSKHAVPVFMGDYDLRITDKCFTKGDTISKITTDRFGSTRNSSPFVGMHEVEVFSYDAGAIEIIEPANPINTSTSYDVKVVVKNFGSQTISSVVVSYELNGSAKTRTFSSLSLAPCDTLHLVFDGSDQASFSAGVNRMRAYTGNVNSNSDADHSNDTSDIDYFCGYLSGTYTIHPTGTGNTNFKTFEDAVGALYACGISGPVTFTVAPGTYMERVQLMGIVNGSSGTNTITFDGVDPSTRILSFDGISASLSTTFALLGTKYVTIKNLGIKNMGTPNALGIRISPDGTQKCDSITIKGCHIEVPVNLVAMSSQFGIGITNSANTLVAGDIADNLTIDGNTIKGGYYGIGSYGDVTYRATNFTIINNVLSNQYYAGIWGYYYHDSMIISNNSINDLGNGVYTAGYSIMAYYADGYKITGNRVCGQNAGMGIYAAYGMGWAGNPSVIANNFISVGNPNLGTTTYGIYLYDPNYVDLVHNSVVVNSLNATSMGIYIYNSGTYTNNNLVNNTFSNIGPGYAIYVGGASNTAFQASFVQRDNNNYFGMGSYTFRFISTIFNDLATWNSATYAGANYDTLSKMINPDHHSICDLHTLNLTLNDAGMPFTSVTTDIDGQSRSSSTPDIGADEYTPPANNIKVVDIINPSAPAMAGLNDVKIVIENVGSATLTIANVNYRVNHNGAIKTKVWSGSLPTGMRDTITFTGTDAYTIIAGLKDTLIAFTNNPNNNPDGFTPNDTVKKCVCEAYSGSYTLGGSAPDFLNFNQAAEELSVCGVSGNVSINVRPGDYTEQTIFNFIPGATDSSIVTFQSSTNMASDVNWRWAGTSVADNFIIKLNNADYLKFRQLSFENTGTTYATAVLISGLGASGSDHNEFEQNIFRGYKSSTTGSGNYIISFTSDNNQYNTFDGNTFLYGSMGIYHPGYAVNPLYAEGLVIENNTFDSIYYMDMYLYYAEKLTVRNNKIITNTAYTSHYGLYLYYPTEEVDVSGNQFLFDQAAAYPIYVRYHNEQYGSEQMAIYNNFISWNFTSGNYGIYSYQNKNIAIAHNSINTTGNQYGMYFYAPSALYDAYLVNNAINTNSGYSIYNAGTIGFVYSDYNNLKTSGTNFAYFSGVIGSLSAWQGLNHTGSDANSLSIDPKYVSATDLHSTAASLIDAGIQVGVTDDIDREPRGTSLVSIGADEFSGDLKLVSLSGPVAVGCERGMEEVIFTVVNTGNVSLPGFNLNLSVDAGTSSAMAVNTVINPGDTLWITHSSKADLSAIGTRMISGWLSTSLDKTSGNDSANLSVLNADNPLASFTHRDTCFGGTVKFTNTSTVVVGNIVSYTWDFDNSNTSTAMDPTQAFSGTGPFDVELVALSLHGCSGSTIIPVNILTDLMPGTIGNDHTVCYGGTPSTLTNLNGASGSGGNYEYQWQSSDDGTNFTDIGGANSSDYSPVAITAERWYRRSVTTTLGCGPEYSGSIKVSVLPEIVAGSIGASQTICYNTTPAALTQVSAPSGGNGSFTHRWERSSDNATWTPISGATNANYTPGNLITNSYYQRVDISGGGCGEKATNSVLISVYSDLTAGTFNANIDICPNNSPGALTQVSGPTGGDGNYTYQWQESNDNLNWADVSGANGATYNPGNLAKTMYFKRIATSGSGCGSRTGSIITVSVRPLPKAIFIANSHCFNDVVPIQNQSTPGYGTLTGYFWDFGNGVTSTSAVPNYTYPTSGLKTIKLVVTNSTGCRDSTTGTSNISNIPAASFNFTYDCGNDSLRFKNTTSVNCGRISAFAWYFGDGNSSTLEDPVHKYASTGTYTIKYIIYLPGGFSDSTIRNITVHPEAMVDFSVADVCYGDVSQFSNTSTNASNYFWTFGDNNNSNQTNPNHLYATSGSYNVKLSAWSQNGCNRTVTKAAIVKVRPDADIVTDDRCFGDSTPFLNGSLYAHTYNWDFGDGTGSNIKAPMHLYGSTGTFTVKLVAYNNNGCVDSTNSNATVRALPVPSYTAANVCMGNSINFNNTSTNANTYVWTFGDGSGSTSMSPTYSYGNPGTFNIGLTAISVFGCKASTSGSVTVHHAPKADFSTANVCNGKPVSFTNNSSIGSGTISYVWDFGDATATSNATSPTHTYSGAGVYSVTLTVTSNNNCTDIITKQVTVLTTPTASYTVSNACLGTAASFTNTSINANTYSWTFGDGGTSTATHPNHTYNATGSYTVTLTARNTSGCEHIYSTTVTIYAAPTVSFTANTVCEGTATTFTNNSSVSTGTMTYLWSFGNGNTSTAPSPTHMYGGPGTFGVTLIGTTNNGCSKSYSAQVTVNAMPKSDFSMSNACINTAVAFTNNSTGGNTYSWNFGDATSSSSATPTKTYTTAGTFTVTLTVTSANNCVAVSSKSITIHPNPVANFTATNVCHGQAMTFTNTSTGATSSRWEFGNGFVSGGTSPSYTYPAAGTYNVLLTATSGNGCKNDITKSVTVYTQPIADFTVANVCLGTAASFTNLTNGTNSYTWNFGDATSSNATSPTKSYASANTYNVQLTAINSNGCNSNITKPVIVFAAPTASFTTADKCLGETVVMNNASTGAVIYDWNFGDNSSSQIFAPVKFYSTAGTYTITLKATSTNNCSHTTTRNVTINPNPVAAFSGAATCTDATAAFTNNSTISSGTFSSSWLFGDGASSSVSSPSHTYPSSGSYLAILNVQSAFGCKASTSSVISVFDAPVADFNAGVVCLGENTMFANTSINANSSSWTFGDGGTSALMFPSHKYATSGTFNVNLTVLGDRGCTSVKSKTVTVNANPTAAFTAANGCQGAAISFTNTSAGASSYAWQFGSEGSDVSMNPAFTFNNPGTVSVKLTAISSQGCRHEMSRNLEVYSSPRASFGVLNNCAGDQTRFVNFSQNGNSNNWNFGDGGSSANSNPSHQYAGAGTYVVSLTVNNANCMHIATQSITINALPSSDFNFTKAGRNVNFTAVNSGAKTYNWSFGDGTQDLAKNPLHQFSTAIVQSFNVCLNVSDNNGCVSETCKQVNIDLLGVDNLNTTAMGIVVYPNPNKGTFSVSVPSGAGNAKVVLESLIGVQVAQSTGFDGQVYQFDAETLASGVYLVKVTLDGKTDVQRVVIRK